MKTYNKAGFSLIELLVALSILAVVAAIIVPRFLNVRQNAAATTASAQAKIVAHTVQQWFSLGGSCSSASGAAAAGSLLDFLSTSNGGSARTATTSPNSSTKCTDSSGTFGSGSVSLQLSNTGDKTKQGFTWTADTSAFYNDGTGDIYDITIDKTTGATTFTPETVTATAVIINA